jgi:hypothetical protein
MPPEIEQNAGSLNELHVSKSSNAPAITPGFAPATATTILPASGVPAAWPSPRIPGASICLALLAGRPVGYYSAAKRVMSPGTF